MALGEGTKAVIREIAREVIKEYAKVAEEDMDRKIHLHSIECEVGKYRKTIAVISACIGGIIMACVNWIINKF